MYYNTQTNTEINLIGTVQIEDKLICGAEFLTDEEKAELNLLQITENTPAHDSRYQNLTNPSYTVNADHVLKEWQIENNTAIYPDLIQQRLDAFAKLKDFDGINDACSYATSTNTQWQAEAQTAITARDATWASFYELITTETDFKQIEMQLPVLDW